MISVCLIFERFIFYLTYVLSWKIFVCFEKAIYSTVLDVEFSISPLGLLGPLGLKYRSNLIF